MLSYKTTIIVARNKKTQEEVARHLVTGHGLFTVAERDCGVDTCGTSEASELPVRRGCGGKGRRKRVKFVLNLPMGAASGQGCSESRYSLPVVEEKARCILKLRTPRPVSGSVERLLWCKRRGKTGLADSSELFDFATCKSFCFFMEMYTSINIYFFAFSLTMLG